MAVAAEFWSRFKNAEDRLVFLASHRGALMRQANKFLDRGEPQKALEVLENDPVGTTEFDEDPPRPAYYVLSVPEGLYYADTMFGLMKEVLSHRMKHLWYERAWRD